VKIGDTIRNLREQQGFDRHELAKRIGVSYHAVAKYETNDRTPPPEILSKLADFFGVTTDYLLGRSAITIDKEDFKEKFKSLSLEEQKAWLSWLVENIKGS